jgi:hypothetical protein
VMSDSDEYLIVEMQPREHETARIRPEPFEIAAFAQSLMEWTTAQHRANARHTLMFHAGEVSPAVSTVRAQADAFIGELERHLLAPPKPHRDQAYWGRAVAEWRLAGSVPPPSRPARRSTWALASPSWRAALFGRVPAVRPWHPRWPDFRRLRSLLQNHIAKGERLLVVGASPGFAAWITAGGWAVEVREVACCIAAQTMANSSGTRFAGALLLIDARNGNSLRAALLYGEKSVRHGAPLIVMVTNGPLDDALRAVPADWWSGTASLAMAGPRIEESLATYRTSLGAGLQEMFVNHMRASYHRPIRQVLSAFLVLLLLPASLASNLLTLRRRTPAISGFWSSLMIVMRSGTNASLEREQSAGADSPSVFADSPVISPLQCPKPSLENIGGFR